MADRKAFSVSVVTPDGAAYEGDAEMLIVPGAAGEIGVLARHAPLIATLKAGSTRVHLGEGVDRLRDAGRQWAAGRAFRHHRTGQSDDRFRVFLCRQFGRIQEQQFSMRRSRDRSGRKW